MVNLTINGRPVQAPAGSLLIEVCRANQIEVPSFCYYPNFSLQAACRMCLVEIEKTPKPQTACTVTVTEGMVVKTDTPVVHQARKSSIEFILTNHPLDCPVCDAGGQCELQDMTFRYGAAESRFEEPKAHRDEQQWSPVVYFDRPRCILCYRCVRVCGEGMDVWALALGGQRGVGSSIIPNRQDHLECEECGMCIDICPVGALTSGPYRYKTRPWEMRHTGSICTFCGDGCKTTLGVRNGQIMRGDNRDKSGINGDFLCIKGRYGFDFTRSEARLRQPLVRRQGELRPASWAMALEAAAKGLRAARQQQGVGVLGSTRLLNEEHYQLQKLARLALKTNHLDHSRSADLPGFLAALARHASSSATPWASSQDLKTAKAVLLVGGDPTQEHPLLAWNLRWAYRLHASRLYILNTGDIKLRRQAHRYAQVAASGLDAALAFLAGAGAAPAAQLTSVPPAANNTWPITPVSPISQLPDGLPEFLAALRQESDVIIVFSPQVRAAALASLVQLGASLPGQTRYIALAHDANSRGASDMGLYPGLLPGYAPLSSPAAAQWERLWGGPLPSEPGLDAAGMLDAFNRGDLDGLYIVGSNPLRRHGFDAASGRRKGFLVVQDLFLTETAAAADVVLPALCAYEKSGTLTNTCGEVQWQRRAADFEGAKSDLEIIHELSALRGHDLGTSSPERIFQEIRAHVPGYDVSWVQPHSGAGALSHLPPQSSVDASPLVRISATPWTRSADGLARGQTLFTDGELARRSVLLNSVMERHETNDAQ